MWTKFKAFIVVGCLVVGIAILLPNLVEPPGGQKPSCINNLRQIKGAEDQWAVDQHKTTNDAPTWDDLRDYFKSVPPKCPNGGTYTLGRIGELPTCSIAKDTDYWKTHYP